MKKKIRVIVRPWTPRNIPYTIPAENAKKILEDAYPKIKKVLYIGWTKRMVNGKRMLKYLAATADSTIDARKIFKYSEEFGENIWNLGE